MKKRFLALILITALICGAMLPSLTLTARAAEIVDSGDCGTNVTWVLDSTGTLTISGIGEMHDYEYENRPRWYSHRSLIKKIFIENGVTSIGHFAFSGCNVLTNIAIPQSVTSIGDSAFDGCIALTDITIPSSVTSVGNYSFYGCAGLTTITIPNSMTSIGHCAFYGCTGLTIVTIPESVTSIGVAAFSGCTNLADIKVDPGNSSFCALNGVLFDKDFATLLCYPAGKTGSTYAIPSGVKGIGGSAFIDCIDLTGVTIPDSVTYIAESAFGDCAGLTNVMIPDSVTYIGEYAFSGCTSLTSVTMPNRITSIKQDTFSNCTSLINITIPSSVTYIGSSAFSGCDKLTEITIPDNVRYIGDSAFRYCYGLTNITIPESVTSIGNSAFSSCSGLTSITIPDSVTSIGDAVFESCTSLTDITVAPGNPSYCAPNGVLFDKNCTKLLCYPAGKTDSTYAIPSGVMDICDSAFYNCSCLTNITIPDSVTSIGVDAFSGCHGLTDITIPASVTSIGDFAFSYCYGLTSITIPEGVTSIGDFAFSYCDGLTNITIPASMTSIGVAAFGGCTGLTGITVDPENLNFCARNGVLFDKNCTKLLCYPAEKTDSTYAIPNGVTSICQSAFYGCANLTDITIPDGVTDIGINAFSYCYGLTSITIPESVTNIGYAAFCGCTGLTNITIPESVTSIGDAAFSGCAGLTNVIIPNSVTCIEWGTFHSCTSLTSIIIPDSVTRIGGAFLNCTALQSIYFKGNAPQCEADVFSWIDEDSAASINNPNLTIYYIDGKEGWTTPMWNGYPTATWDGVNLPKPHEHDYKAVVTAPTCTEQGYTTHTCECGASYVDTYTDALGHDWGAPDYKWSNDHSAVTAERVCKRDTHHAEIENGLVTSVVTKEATYDSEGEITYTATFTNPAFSTQVKIVATPKLGSPADENPFADIRESAYYYDSVLWAVANNVTNGTSASTFSPEEGCTRAQVVTFLWRAAGQPAPASSTNPFTDVKPGAYYYNAVLWAMEKGITNGTSDTTFGPDETCTRAQIVTFLWRYEGQPAPASTNNPFADVRTSAYFGSAVLWAVESDITNGTSATTFDPEDTCTRAQVVTFLYRDIAK